MTEEKQTMKNYNNDNPLDFNTNPDPYWNAKPLYGKPDLQALYAQKEQEKLERNVETEMCWKLVKECGEVMRQTLTDYPDDLEEIKKTARFIVIWLKKRVDERNFKRLSKFDVQRMLEAEIKAVRREFHLV